MRLYGLRSFLIADTRKTYKGNAISGIKRVLGGSGSFVFRFRPKAFHLYDAEGVKIELFNKRSDLNDFQSTDINCFYRLSDGTLHPIRVVATKKDTDAIAKSEHGAE